MRRQKEMTDAYLDTTILTDLLLKPLTKKRQRAREALGRYSRTLLPVYAIKEWKAGPLLNYAWVHDKLAFTGSLTDTVRAVSELTQQYRKSTGLDAVAAAGAVARRKSPPYAALGSTDRDMADSYRLALANLAIRSWNRRRKLTTEVVGELECYTEAAPRVDKDGFLDIKPFACDPEQECCLAERLKAEPDTLKALRNAIPENSGRREHERRRHALKKLIKHPKEVLDQETCRDLGDALFAFFCPKTAVILTTNLKDHNPLAKAVGKSTESP